MGPNMDAPARQNLEGDAPGDTQGGGETAGEVSAAAVIGESPELLYRHPVRMRRARMRDQVFVVARQRVFVVEQDGQRRAGRAAVEDARQQVRRIALLTRRRAAFAAFAAAEVFFERGLVEFESRGYSVEGHADRFAVRLSEYGNSE